MSDARLTNRKAWIAIGMLVLFTAASSMLKSVVDEITKPVYDIPAVDPEHPDWSWWVTEE
jgi:hypothetical protein